MSLYATIRVNSTVIAKVQVTRVDQPVEGQDYATGEMGDYHVYIHRDDGSPPEMLAKINDYPRSLGALVLMSEALVAVDKSGVKCS